MALWWHEEGREGYRGAVEEGKRVEEMSTKAEEVVATVDKLSVRVDEGGGSLGLDRKEVIADSGVQRKRLGCWCGKAGWGCVPRRK